MNHTTMSTFTIEEEPVDLLDSAPLASPSAHTKSSKSSHKSSHRSKKSSDTTVDQSSKKSKSKSKSKKSTNEDLYSFSPPLKPSTPAGLEHLIDINDTTLNHSISASMLRIQEQKLVRDWCVSNGFDESVQEVLSEYSIEDCMSFEREDWKDLFGTKLGMKLHTRCKALKQSHTHSLRQSTRHSIKQCKYGQCSLCEKGAQFVCSNEKCGVALCHSHSEKALLTSEIFCHRCLDETLEGKVSCWMQSWQQTINQSVEQSMEATQVLTGFNALPTLTQQSDDCTIM